MKKLLAIVVLGLLWSGNVYSKHLSDHPFGLNNKNKGSTLTITVPPSKNTKKIEKLEREIKALKKGSLNNEVFENFMRNHSCWDKFNKNAEKYYECFFYPRTFNNTPADNFFKAKWLEGGSSRNEFIKVANNIIKSYKKSCNDITLINKKKILCKTNFEKLNVKILSIPN